MMPTISVSDATYRKLQALAVPFVDDPEDVIVTLADEALARRGRGGSVPGKPSVDAATRLRLNPDRPDDLTHTRVLSARIDGEEISRPKWQTILISMHELAASRLGSFEAVRKATGANVREGRYEDQGFKYLPAAGLSIQGQDSKRAWQHALHLARALGVPIEVELEWRHKDGAAHPGEAATIAWHPSSSQA